MIIDMVLAQAAIWAPSLVAVLGIVATIIPAYNKIKTVLAETKESNTEVRKTKDFEKLHADLRQAHLDNKELKEQISLLIDKFAGVKDYEKAGTSDERENKETKD